MTHNSNVLKTKVSGSVWVGMHSVFSWRYTKNEIATIFQLPYPFIIWPWETSPLLKILLSETHENERVSRFDKDRPNRVLSTSSQSQFCWSNSLLTHKMYHTAVITKPHLQVSLSWFATLSSILWLNLQGHWCINSFFSPELPWSIVCCLLRDAKRYVFMYMCMCMYKYVYMQHVLFQSSHTLLN